VQFADFHLGGAQDECHVSSVPWVSTLKPWVELDCVSGSYLKADNYNLLLAAEIASIRSFKGRIMPLMRWWEQARAMLFLGVVRHRKILDVGTRESILPSYLASRGANVTAIDLSTDQIIRCPGVTVQQADATDLPFADNSFDAVVCTACIKLIVEDTKAVSEMLRVLKPHRLLAITFDFGQEYAEFPSEATGRRIYDKQGIMERLVNPFQDVSTLCGPVDFDRSDWTDWPIESQSPATFARGVNAQVGFILLRKNDKCE